MIKSIINACYKPITAYIGSKQVWQNEWSPTQLFKNGEQGIWLDPSDLKTMFQDVNGLVPVTKDGAPVGLILDKSQGLFDSSYIDFDLIGLNPEKSSGSGAITHDGDAIVYDITGFSGSNSINVPTTVSEARDKVFVVTLDIENLSGSGVEIKIFASGAAPTLVTLKANEHLRGTFTFKTDSILETRLYFRTSRSKLKVNSVKIKEVKGNHAKQPTASARPIYRTDGILHWLQFDGVDDHIIINHMEGTRGVNLISTISPSIDYFRIASKGSGVTHQAEKGDWLLSPDKLNNLRVFSGLRYVNRIEVLSTNNIKANTYEYYSNASGQVIAMNGVEKSISAADYVENDKPIYIGTDSLLQLPLKGRLFGFTLRFNIFTNEERQQAVRYLKTKAGVTL